MKKLPGAKKAHSAYLQALSGTSYDHNAERTIALQALGFRADPRSDFAAGYCWRHSELGLTYDGNAQIDVIVNGAVHARRLQTDRLHREVLRDTLLRAMGLCVREIDTTDRFGDTERHSIIVVDD